MEENIPIADEVKSTHRVEIVRVEIVPHPNADTLEIAKVFGYTCCVRKGDFTTGDLAAYLVPDSLVPTEREEFSFLEGHPRIKVKRLRGVLSQGLLMPAPPGAKEGDNVSEFYGVTRYEPPIQGDYYKHIVGGECEPPPNAAVIPKYDVEALERFPALFTPGEPIVATEKIHGANGRYLLKDGRMWAGSRTQWKKNIPGNLWWKTLEQNPWIEAYCKDNEGHVLYGEVFGYVQTLHYGLEKGEFGFRVFDILRQGEWMPEEELDALESGKHISGKSIRRVPIVYRGPFDFDHLKTISMGPSLLPKAKHYREGIVVKPVKERTCLEIGRVLLKLVSEEYYLKEGKQ